MPSYTGKLIILNLYVATLSFIFIDDHSGVSQMIETIGAAYVNSIEDMS